MRPLVVVLLVATAVLALIDSVVTIVHRRLPDFTVIQHGWPVITVTGLIGAAMGALILRRHPRQPIGWLLLIPGLTTCLSLACDAWSKWVLLADGPGSTFGALVAGWIASFLGAQIPLAANALIVLLAPDGRLPGRVWRWPALLVMLGALAWSAAPLLEAATYAAPDPQVAGTSAVLTVTGLVLVDVGLVVGLGSLWWRHRQARGARRLQTGWLLAAGIPQVVGILWLVAARYGLIPWLADRGLTDHALDTVALTPLFTAELLFPIGVAVAVLRYRLYDLGLVLNRAWLVLAAAGFVGTGYVLVVATAGSVPSGFWPSLLVSVALACAFQPVRTQLVAAADRLAYGARPTPASVVGRLTRTLGAAADLTTTVEAAASAGVTGTAAARVEVEAYAESGAVAAIAAAGGPPAPSPRAGSAIEEFPLLDDTDLLGTLRVTVDPGRPLRRRDREVLVGLADQAASAVRFLRLDAALAERVGDLERTTRDLVDARRRWGRARATELHRLDLTVASMVGPPLRDAVTGLEALAADVAPRPEDARWDAVAASVGEALSGLRRVAHGIHPALLESAGPAAAIEALLAHHPGGPPLTVIGPAGRRPDPAVESAVYRCVVTALATADRLTAVLLDLSAPAVRLTLEGEDGPTDVTVALLDQVALVDGSVTASPTDSGSRWSVEVAPPASAPPDPITNGPTGTGRPTHTGHMLDNGVRTGAP